MGRHILVVMSSPVDRREDEYNKWYSDVHLQEVIELPGFVSAQRFEMADTQLKDILTPAEINRAYGETEHRYLAVYEIEAESAGAALQALREARPHFRMSDALGAELNVWAYTPITDEVRSP